MRLLRSLDSRRRGPYSADIEARWIRTPEDLTDLARTLAGSPTLAWDTESDSFYHYFEKICLLQVADASGRTALIDTLVVRDLSPMAPVFADPGIVKLLHGAEYDLALLKRDFGFEIRSLHDTQVAARFCGRTEFGLAAMLEREFGVRLSKSAQRCDWSLRPLTPAQVAYAAEDVAHLIPLDRRLDEELARLGRLEWAREECDALVAETPPAIRRETGDFRSAKGAWQLHPRDLAVLRELFALRDAWARELDRPLFKVLGDEPLIQLAVRRPKTVQALDRFRGLSTHLVRRHGAQILDAIQRGTAVPDAECPRITKRRGLRMPQDASERIDRLKAWRRDAAERAKLDPGLLLPQRLIERIALSNPRDLEALSKIESIRRWRVGNFGRELLASIDRRGLI